MNFNDVAIIPIKGSERYISKDDAANIMENSNLNEKIGLL